MNPNDFVGVAGAPLVVALVEVVKRTWPKLPARFYPAISVAMGVALNEALAVGLLGGDWRTAAFAGLVTGLIASGLFRSGKAAEVKGL